jgi:hypothetical protein
LPEALTHTSSLATSPLLSTASALEDNHHPQVTTTTPTTSLHLSGVFRQGFLYNGHGLPPYVSLYPQHSSQFSN